MKKFDYHKLKNLKLDGELVTMLTNIYKFHGGEEVYLKEKNSKQEELINLAKIKSTISSNAIEGIYSTEKKLSSLYNKISLPSTRNEKEILGYLNTLDIIIENYEAIIPNKTNICFLHQKLLELADIPHRGRLKSINNAIVQYYSNGEREIIFQPPNPFESSLMLEQLCEEFNIVIGNSSVEPLLAIPIFIHDFLCIHPFNDGNGRMSRLLTTLLLLRSGFKVPLYISLEDKINNTKNLYYASLDASSKDWHENKEDPTPFIKYLLKIILLAYEELDYKLNLVHENLSALDTVRMVLKTKIGKITKQDIYNDVPFISISSIEQALRELVELKELKRVAKGRSTYYIKLK